MRLAGSTGAACRRPGEPETAAFMECRCTGSFAGLAVWAYSYTGLPVRNSRARPPRASSSSFVYRRRRPERPLRYWIVQAHLTTWLARQNDWCGGSAPGFTEREFHRYLACGILAHGFARARCEDRGICHACTTRCMVETAVHLVDHLIPPLPVRQCFRLFPYAGRQCLLTLLPEFRLYLGDDLHARVVGWMLLVGRHCAVGGAVAAFRVIR